MNKDRWQLCPKCQGQGVVALPPNYHAGYGGYTSQTSWTCDVCNGTKLLDTWPTPPPRTYEQGVEEARDAAIDAIERLRDQIEDGSPASNSSDIALYEAQERIRHMALPTQPEGEGNERSTSTGTSQRHCRQRVLHGAG